MYIPAKPSTLPILQKLAADKGLTFGTRRRRSRRDTMKLKPVRIGLWDQYGGSMPSGWTRWIFEQYEFPFEVVYPGDARRRQPEREVRRAGVRRRRHPVSRSRGRRSAGRLRGAAARGHDPGGVPRLAGPHQRREDGARAEEVRRERRHRPRRSDRRQRSAYHLGLPIRDALVERVAGGAEQPLPREKFYIPGTDPRGADRPDAPARLRDGRARRW